MQKVQVKIAGIVYNIATDNDAAYAMQLAAEVDDTISAITGSSKVTPDQAMVLALLNYADIAKKANAEAETLKSQLKEYLADAAQAKSERDMLKRELAKIKKNNGDI